MLLAFQIDIDTVAYVFSLSAREAGLILGQVIGRGVVVIRPCQKKNRILKSMRYENAHIRKEASITSS